MVWFALRVDILVLVDIDERVQSLAVRRVVVQDVDEETIFVWSEFLCRQKDFLLGVQFLDFLLGQF